ncbi:MAG: hypothetical protein ABI036_20340 [Fibrobacteria bacterium]
MTRIRTMLGIALAAFLATHPRPAGAGTAAKIPPASPVQGVHNAPSPASPPSILSTHIRMLDQARIHSLYAKGDFKSFITSIDSFLLMGPPPRLEDSVFIAKHLAVIYSANPATQDLSRAYLNTLMEILPISKVLDLFVAGEREQLFGKIQRDYATGATGNTGLSEFESSRYALDKMTVTQPEEAAPVPKETAKPLLSKGPSPKYFWVAGGVTLAAVAGYYFIQSQYENKPEERVIIVSQ